MKTWVTIALLYLTLHSFGQSDQNSYTSTESEILSVIHEMESTFNLGNYSKIGEYYAENAVMVGSRTEATGREELISYWGKFENAHSWKIENTEIMSLSDTVALQRGYSNITYFSDGELHTSRSIFSLIWIRNKKGWKILLDHFSTR